MIKIYHNPRCGKFRNGLKILEKSGKPFEVIKYLDDLLFSDGINKLKYSFLGNKELLEDGYDYHKEQDYYLCKYLQWRHLIYKTYYNEGHK